MWNGVDGIVEVFQLKTTHKQPLPDPNGEMSPSLGISSANACIGKLLNSMLIVGVHVQIYHQLWSLKLVRKLLKCGQPAVMRSFTILCNGYTIQTYHEYYPPLLHNLKFHQQVHPKSSGNRGNYEPLPLHYTCTPCSVL